MLHYISPRDIYFGGVHTTGNITSNLSLLGDDNDPRLLRILHRKFNKMDRGKTQDIHACLFVCFLLRPFKIDSLFCARIVLVLYARVRKTQHTNTAPLVVRL